MSKKSTCLRRIRCRDPECDDASCRAYCGQAAPYTVLRFDPWDLDVANAEADGWPYDPTHVCVSFLTLCRRHYREIAS